MLFKILFLSALCILLPTSTLATANNRQCASSRWAHRHRLFVLTDISNEPDDQMSLVRLLTYANEMDIQGIAAVTSIWLRNRTDADTIRDVIDGYGKVVKNLNANVPSRASYPPARRLLDLVTEAHPVYGLEALDLPLSEAAEALVKAADESANDDPL